MRSAYAPALAVLGRELPLESVSWHDLEEIADKQGDLEACEAIADPRESLEDYLGRRQAEWELRSLLRKIIESNKIFRAKDVIRHRIMREETLSEVGDRYDVGKERIRQVERAVMSALKHKSVVSKVRELYEQLAVES